MIDFIYSVVEYIQHTNNFILGILVAQWKKWPTRPQTHC